MRLGVVVSGLTLGAGCLGERRRADDQHRVGAQPRAALPPRHRRHPSPLVLLTAGLTFLCTIYSLKGLPEAGRPRGLIGLLLLLEVGMLGTFVALDLLLFFVFFEVVLVPMWFVIAQWGDPSESARRVGAANTFILYTLLGSAVMLLGILLVGFKAGTFDITTLTASAGKGLSRPTQVLVFAATGRSAWP